ncbi:MAG: AraC family transcriptional regulator [Ferruginibacter sp.]|nr:AraC family transcriptional regulator [Ferruginibacter sp.]
MKALLKIINTPPKDVFQLMKVDESYFFPSWHFHPEFEIMLVLEGRGIRFVGDSMERFQAGDLVFFGKEIPHFYRSDDEYYEKTSGDNSKALVLYFREDFLGETIWDMPDISHLKKLISASSRGIKFNGPVKEKIINQLRKLDDGKDSLAKVIDLLTLLQTMADARGYTLLSSRGFKHNLDEVECNRMNTVYQYIINNYSENPSLEDVAKIAFLSGTSFCRYFKSHTNKTYTQFLNEIKIGNACKFLIEDNMSVSQVCFETGFNNFTHFNSQFKRITGITPSQYKQKHSMFENTGVS